MKFRFVSPRLHGVFDYVAAINLIVLPFLLGLGTYSPLALWLSVGAGVGLFVYSLFTDYAFSMSNAVPFKLHLLFDLAAGAAFIIAIFIFDFEGLAAGYYAVMGAGVFALVAVTNTGEESSAVKVTA